MKEIISAVVFVVSIWGGSVAIKKIHDGVRAAALEKAAKGMPSLQGISRGLRGTKPIVNPQRTGSIDGFGNPPRRPEIKH